MYFPTWPTSITRARVQPRPSTTTNGHLIAPISAQPLLWPISTFTARGILSTAPSADLPVAFWQDQFSSLYVLSTIGMSYYNAGQLILRHPTSHGLRSTSATRLSNSIDMGSDAERGTEFTGQGGNFSNIINTWKPYLNRAYSDFDIRHLITADWVYELPFGRGRTFIESMPMPHSKPSWADGNGLVFNRWTSGLPFSALEPGWTTNWQQESNGVAPARSRCRNTTQRRAAVFRRPTAINSGTATGGPVRLSYPGEADNATISAVTDSSASIPGWPRPGNSEYGALKFSWEVYNVTNAFGLTRRLRLQRA